MICPLPLEVAVFPPGALVRDVDAPERGVGRVLRYDEEQRAAEVLYENSEQPHVVRPNSTVKRLALQPGQGVRTLQGEEGLVGGFVEREEGEPWYYRVTIGGEERELIESELEPLPPKSGDPLDLLRALRWRGGWRFFARWNLADKAAGWSGEAEGLSAWLAERRPVSPVVYAAEPRAVLALPSARERRDALGLIWLALSHETPRARMLVIVPGGATRTWASRLFLDHGGRAMTHVDLGRWQQTPDFLRDEVLGATPGIVVSAAALAFDPELRDALTMFPWELVAVESAQLLSDEVAEWVEEVAAGAMAGVCLIPPPAVFEPEEVCSWLGLTGVEVDRAALSARAAQLRAAAWDLSADDGELLTAAKVALAGDPYGAELIAREDVAALRVYLSEERGLDPRLIVARETGLDPSEPPEELVVEADLAEVAWLDQLAAFPLVTGDALSLAWREVLFEATWGGPAAVTALLEARGRALGAPRISPTLADALAQRPSPGELALLTSELVAAAPAAPGEKGWIEEARAHVAQWRREGWGALRVVTSRIEDHLVDGGDAAVVQVLGGASAVEAVAEGLVEALGEEAVAILHDGLDETTRSEVLQQFRSQATCCVLVSDSVVSGGRRVGSAELSVQLGIPFDPGARDWAELNELPQQLRIRGDDPWSVALSGAEDPACGAAVWPAGRRALSEALPRPAELSAALRPAPLGAGAAAHGLAPARIEEASEVTDLLEEAGVEGDAQELRAWSRSLRLRLDQGNQREWSASWRSDGLDRELPGLPDEGSGDRRRVRGTFDPICAREREGLGVFAPGHPLIDALVRDAAHPNTDGRLTVIRRELGSAWPGRLALIVVARCQPDLAGLPRGLARRAERRLWAEPFAEVVALFPGQDPPARPVTDRAARNQALAPFVGKEVEPKVDPDALCEAIPLDVLLRAVEAGVALALEQVRAERAPLCEDAVAQLEADLAPARAGAALRGEDAELWEQLLAGVRGERVELDALALLVG